MIAFHMLPNAEQQDASVQQPRIDPNAENLSEEDKKELELREKAKNMIDEFKQAKESSAKGSQLRNCIGMPVAYVDEPHISVVTDENGDLKTRFQEPEEFFLEKLRDEVEKSGSYYCQYLKFRDIVRIEPLMPDN